jgi:arabinosaccharide transport system substrate-binding protein
MNFPFGRAALWILLLGLASGAVRVYYTAREARAAAAQAQTTLKFWTFAKQHHDAYQTAFDDFEKKNPGVKVEDQLVSWVAVTQRLQAAMWSGVDLPDVVEIPIDTAGGYFRGPIDDVGFLDLTERVKKEGLLEDMVPSRFTPYTSRGRIFGVPHDVHPVMLAYNAEIFKKENINPDSIQTWDDFVRVGKKLTIPGKRYMIELEEARSAHLEMCLFQRDSALFDTKGNVIFDDETGVQTMLWFVPLIAAKDRIANNLGGGQILTKAVEDGYFVCLVAPDWRSKTIEKDIPSMSGKMKLMPLPAVKPGGRRTSTWGGTMIGITKQCKNPDLAWKLAMQLYLDKKELGQRFRDTNILPALRSAWKQPEFDEKREYWCGQQVGNLYAALAPQTPAQVISPFIAQGKAKLGEALVDCITYYRANGDSGFEKYARQRLKKSGDELRALIARNPY